MSHTLKGPSESNDLDELHVFARTVDVLAIVTAVLYLRALAQGGFFSRNVSDPSRAAPVMFVLLLVGVAGLIAAWRWECAGAAVAIVGAVALVAYITLSLHSAQLLAAFVYSSPFFVAGGMCLYDWWRRRLQKRA